MTRKINSHPPDKGRRRRRKPEAAESEILNAAERFLRERPLREMTIDDVMSGTGLSRPSFYEYFRDRNQLIIKLAERLGAQNAAIGDKWFRGEHHADDLRRVIEEVVELTVTRGHLLRALADAAISDREVEATYRQGIQTAIDNTAQHIRNLTVRGVANTDHLDAKHLATALIHMNQAYLIETMGRRPQSDPKAVAETLIAIWTRVLFSASR